MTKLRSTRVGLIIIPCLTGDPIRVLVAQPSLSVTSHYKSLFVYSHKLNHSQFPTDQHLNQIVPPFQGKTITSLYLVLISSEEKISILGTLLGIVFPSLNNFVAAAAGIITSSFLFMNMNKITSSGCSNKPYHITKSPTQISHVLS